MIRVAVHGEGAELPSAVIFGMDVLLDLSGIARTTDDQTDVLVLRVDHRPDGVRTARDLSQWHPQVRNGELRIGTDTLTAVTDIAAAAAEQKSVAADRYQRVPSNVNALVAEGMERLPVLDLAARRLRDAAVSGAGERCFRLLPSWPHGATWAAAFTHDLDVVRWWPLFAALRWVELGRSRHLDDLRAAVLAALRAAGSDPVLAAAREILGIEARYEVRSTWFVLSGTPTFTTFRHGDLTYAPEDRCAREIVRAVAAARGEIGLHGSFATLTDVRAFRAERERAAIVTGGSIDGVRQHFLRMRPPVTQRAMVGAGFRYDATFGFPDRNGFRLGSANPLEAYDADAGAPLPICLAPLTWMDRAMSKYSGIQDPSRWADDALELADAVNEVGGMWVGLWHPNLAPALGYPNAPREYERLVREIRGRGAYIAPLGELMTFRRQRRAFRITRIAADGTFQSNDATLAASLLAPVSR